MRNNRRSQFLIGFILLAGFLITACQPQTVIVTQVVTEIVEIEGAEVVVTQVVEVEVPAEEQPAEDLQSEAGPAVLRVGTLPDAFRYDPEVPTDVTVGKSTVNLNIFETLTRIDENFQVIPWLATSWEYDDARGVWIFNLRDDVFFHDGVQFTAQHVAEYFNYFSEGSFMADLLFTSPGSATAVDDFTLEIESTFLQMPAAAAHVTTGIRRGDPFAGEHIGTGPFVFVEYEQNDRIIVEKNENYWGDPAQVDRMEFYFMPDPMTRVLSLIAGDVDLIYEPPRASLVAMADRSDIRFFDANVSSYQTLDMMVDNDPPNDLLKDAAIREAIAYAINREDVMQLAWGGFALDSQTLVAPTLLGEHAPLVQGYTYDPDYARTVLEDAGWVDTDDDGVREKDGRRLSLHLVSGFPNAAANSTTPEILQGHFAEIGIELEVVPAPDWPTYSSYLIPKATDMFLSITTNTTTNPCSIPNFKYGAPEGDLNWWQDGMSPAKVGFPEVSEELANCMGTFDDDEAAYWAAESLHTIIDEARTTLPLAGLFVTFAANENVLEFRPHPILSHTSWNYTSLAE